MSRSPAANAQANVPPFEHIGTSARRVLGNVRSLRDRDDDELCRLEMEGPPEPPEVPGHDR